AVGADAAFAMMPDEDGDLRLRAAAGSISLPGGESAAGAPSVVTVPFLVDGQVTGLLAAAAAAPAGFGDPEAARLQRLADRSGPALQRAWLAELERLRRGRGTPPAPHPPPASPPPCPRPSPGRGTRTPQAPPP